MIIWWCGYMMPYGISRLLQPIIYWCVCWLARPPWGSHQVPLHFKRRWLADQLHSQAQQPTPVHLQVQKDDLLETRTNNSIAAPSAGELKSSAGVSPVHLWVELYPMVVGVTMYCECVSKIDVLRNLYVQVAMCSTYFETSLNIVWMTT